MSTHPLARPLSRPARPELTDGRALGVLLLHGFSGSPASMKPWAEYLHDKGYAVEVPLLPGHGTRWQDLNEVAWTDWYETASDALDSLVGACDRVVVAALSMGGSLALRLAQERPGDVAGVVLVNPFVSSRRKELMALPLLKMLVPSLPGVVNDIKKPGQDEVGYPRLPLKGLAEVLKMWRSVVPDLPKVTQPLLYFRSSVDHVIDSSSSQTVLGAVSSRDASERILDNSYHVATLDHEAEIIFAESADFVARVTA
ncbi:alpha/beta hydrolase [Nocardioides coralli]|uniref:alpha/beta hydrolase n=1 Tax=Nocardioides coralli TaxID=2872154 RepID=UPI001CA43EA1|nr:alpha/beta fold hydrolase [Nocardioides coralli]QZY28001.1 alpha/beta fold hydrolase [Nocardioides coralli]